MIFRNWVLQNFPFLEDDFDALTDYELFCKMMEYVKKFAKDNENFNKRLTDLENYIDNLDLQDEVNNKLDEMAESGELENIISQYIELATTYVYNNVNEMKSATNLINGSFARTSGFYSYNDGGGAYYKIRTILNTDIIDNYKLFAITNDNTLVAELIKSSDEINLLQLGVDNENDCSTILQYAINNYKKIIIPSGTHIVEHTINLANNIEITGNGANSILLMNNNLEDLILFNIDDKHNIKINNINLQNTESETGSTYLENRIICNINDSNDIIFDNFYMENIYKNGIVVKTSHDLTFNKCNFKNTGYSMLSLLTEVENVIIDNCIFDTNTSSYSGGTYLLHTGSEDYITPVNFYVKNLLVQNSKFLNNPTWEGLESHGGENIRFINNYIYNCKIGIMMRHDSRTPVINSWKTHNIIIENNVIDGNEICTDGITAGGSTNDFCENFDIVGNTITNIKSGDSSVSCISFQYGSKFNINRNKISKFGYYGIRTFDSYYGNVNDNYISNPVGRVDYGFYSNYCWFINFNNNVIDGSPNISDGNKITYGAGTPNNSRGLVQLLNNTYIVADTSCVNMRDNTRINPSASDSKRFGNVFTNYKGIDDRIKAYFTNNKLRSVAGNVDSLSVSAVAGTSVLTYTGTVYPIRLLGIGEEITIVGAGDSGSDLTTTVKSFPSLNSVELSNPILTTITNATLKTLDSTIVII